MTGRWKAGDVAVVTALNFTEPTRAIYDGRTWKTVAAWCVDEPTSCRPLVAIDPEDREQVERLWRAWRDLAPDHQLAQDNMQAALRSLVTPPKPDEPTGLGAVMEDENGSRWIRHGNGPAAWMLAGASPSNRDTYRYSDIVAVKVLSEGVPA